MQVNARDLHRNRSITLIRKRRYFMRNQKKKKRRHPRSTKYNLCMDEYDGKPELSSRTKSGNKF
jgi:hypothetical protein